MIRLRVEIYTTVHFYFLTRLYIFMYSEYRLATYYTNTLTKVFFFSFFWSISHHPLYNFIDLLTFSLIDIDSDWHVEIKLADADLELHILIRQQHCLRRENKLTPLLLLQQIIVCWQAVVLEQM